MDFHASQTTVSQRHPNYPDQYFRLSRSFGSKRTIFGHSIDGKLLLPLPGSLWLPVPMLCHPGWFCTNWDFGQKEKKETFICVTWATEVCLQPIHLSCPCNNTLLTKLLHTGFFLSSPMSLNFRLSHWKVLKCILIIQLFKFKWTRR